MNHFLKIFILLIYIIWVGLHAKIGYCEVITIPYINAWQKQAQLVYEKSYALLIANQNYDGKDWNKLQSPAKDMSKLADALKDHGFEVIQKKDLNSAETLKTIRNFFAEFGAAENNRLLFWYSGHGSKDGYIIPIDTPAIDDPKFTARAIGTTEITEMSIKQANKARHVLMVFDSCFGSDNFKSADGKLQDEKLDYIEAEQKSRLIITSGGPNQKVQDNGYFTDFLINELKKPQTPSNNGILKAKNLAVLLKERFRNNPNQTPWSAVFGGDRYAFGDFVFRLGESICQKADRYFEYNKFDYDKLQKLNARITNCPDVSEKITQQICFLGQDELNNAKDINGLTPLFAKYAQCPAIISETSHRIDKLTKITENKFNEIFKNAKEIDQKIIDATNQTQAIAYKLTNIQNEIVNNKNRLTIEELNRKEADLTKINEEYKKKLAEINQLKKNIITIGKPSNATADYSALDEEVAHNAEDEKFALAYPWAWEIITRVEKSNDVVLDLNGRFKNERDKLTFLPPRIGKLKNISELIINNNKLTVLPKWTANLKNLTHLDVSDNFLFELTDISNLKKIEQLNLSNNQLTNLPDLSGLTMLKNLWINYNKLSVIPEWITKIDNIRDLRISNNRIKEIADLSSLKNLTALYIWGNEIEIVPQHVGNLINLRILSLSKNNIKKIPDLSALTSLSELYLWGNKIQELPESIVNLKNLALLELSNNSELSKIPNLALLKSLKYLDLSGTAINLNDLKLNENIYIERGRVKKLN